MTAMNDTTNGAATRIPAATAAPDAYDEKALRAFAYTLLTAAGVRDEIARDTADILVDADLMGHTTHGLALLPAYLQQLADGGMRKTGEPTIVARAAAGETWDGERLPGPWLSLRALDRARALATSQGSGTIAIRRSHHIACLAAYAKRGAEQGGLTLVHCSDPSGASVAPFGAVTPVFTPNPLSAGIPTSGDPILLDISASYTTNGMTTRLYNAREMLPHPWLQDAQGAPTRDPAVLFDDPKGTLLPLGGHEAGHKGFALALLVEALTSALAGHGRANAPQNWGASVFVQVLDPRAFGGLDAFRTQIDWLVRACHDATPRPGGPPVRLPGERALALYREQSAHGVVLHPGIMPALVACAERLGVPAPPPTRVGGVSEVHSRATTTPPFPAPPRRPSSG
jgi:L-lactate dehydrogenase